MFLNQRVNWKNWRNFLNSRLILCSKMILKILKYWQKNIPAKVSSQHLRRSTENSDPLAFPGAYYNMANIAASGKYFGYAILNLKKFLLLGPSEEEARKAQDLIYLWEIKGR